MSSSTQPKSALSERNNFVSASRPAAPIKTAIIRPTNFYDGTRRSSFGSADSDKHHQSAGEKGGFRSRLQSHPVVDSVPEADLLSSRGDDVTDPLSDTSAVMYGTNATCRRRSKVEAWIESSSHSEESVETDQLQLVDRMRSYDILPSKMDLSLDELCNELLAFSCCHSTYDKILNQANSNHKTADGVITESSNQPAKCTKTENMEHLSNKLIKQARTPTDWSVSHTKVQITSTKHSAPTGSGASISSTAQLPESQPPAIPPRKQSSFRAVECLSKSSHQQCKSEIQHTPAQSWRQGDIPQGQLTSVLIPADKVGVLTVDVGEKNRRNTSRVYNTSNSDRLITVTSPKYNHTMYNIDLFMQDNVPYMTHSNETSNNKPPVLLKKSATSPQMASQHTLEDVEPAEDLSMCHQRRKPKASNESAQQLERSSEKTDHVAAAITTQPRNSIVEGLSHHIPRKIHRSLSEPSAFVTLTPDKRLGITRSPSKKSKNRLFKIGMDVIRNVRSDSHKTIKELPSPLDSSQTSTIKDNRIMNNLNHQQADKGVKPPEKILGQRFTSEGSDSVFEDQQQPTLTSTFKSHQSNQSGGSNSQDSTISHNKSRHHESLSSSFESEARDYLATLKSSNAMKSHRFAKFPTNVDPITGSPREPHSHCMASHMDGNRMLRSHSAGCSGGGMNSPTAHPMSIHLKPPATCPQPCRSPQTQAATRRVRKSYYDNLPQSSPFPGVRVSMESASSSGTVFSRPWGDISKWEDYLRHNCDFRHRLDSNISSMHHRHLDLDDCSNPTKSQHSSSDHSKHEMDHCHRHVHTHQGLTTPASSESSSYMHNPLHSHKFSHSIPDVAIQAFHNTDSVSPSVRHVKTSWEAALDRAINRVRCYTKLLDGNAACEITRHSYQTLINADTLPGTLVGRFLTCTRETNPSDTLMFSERLNKLNKKNIKQLEETTLKTNWYPTTLDNHWLTSVATGKRCLPYTTQAYANDGYLLHSASMGSCRTSDRQHPSTDLKILSNVRQFIDGMKRYLLNEPDTQMMFAIQRERVKLGVEQFINLDAVMESVLEKVIINPLSDHMLSVTTLHPDYSLQQIARIEAGMKAIVLHKEEYFIHMAATVAAIDGYEDTIRSAFQSVKTKFSPLVKLQYLLQIALLIVLVHNKTSTHRQNDLIYSFIYAMSCYGEATLIVHMTYVRNLIPLSLRSGATAYIFNLYETCAQVYDRITKVNSTPHCRLMILREILDKLTCKVIVADEANNHVIKRDFALSKSCTVSELIQILHIDSAEHDVTNHQLYVVTDDRETLLRHRELIIDVLSSNECQGQNGPTRASLVFRRPNTQMLLRHQLNH